MKHRIGNIVATLFAIAAGLFAMWALDHYIKHPQGPFDWIVLFFSGATVGVFIFFVTWGHFQTEPLP